MVGSQAMSEIMPAITAKIESPNLIPSIDLLKQGERRLIFRAEGLGDEGLIIKSFPLPSLRDKLKYKRYAYSEANNLLMASERGLNVPVVLGYGFAKKRGLPHWNAVCMEEIQGASMKELLREAKTDESKLAILDNITDVVVSFYQAGCNHIDLNCESIIFQKNDLQRPFVIDFQYCVFQDSGQCDILAAHVGHIARDLIAKDCMSRELAYAWFERIKPLFDKYEYPAMTTAFERHLDIKISRKERLSM
jgi:tRNA A-37 threonylcarbamoyl transferase component Bud32